MFTVEPLLGTRAASPSLGEETQTQPFQKFLVKGGLAFDAAVLLVAIYSDWPGMHRSVLLVTFRLNRNGKRRSKGILNSLIKKRRVSSQRYMISGDARRRPKA